MGKKNKSTWDDSEKFKQLSFARAKMRKRFAKVMFATLCILATCVIVAIILSFVS